MLLTARQIERNIDWLLTHGSAPVKYLTYKQLLSTAGSTKVMRNLWRDVENDPCVQDMFGKQREDGSWHAGGSWAHGPSYTLKRGIDPYIPKYTTATWILPLLGEMGYTAADERVRKACRFVCSHGAFRDPLFSKPTSEIGQSETNLCPCRFAQYMIALGAVSFVDDVKVEKGYEVLLRLQRDDGGWVDARHYEQMGWSRSCLFSTYHGTMALYHAKNPAHRDALVRGAQFMLWHLSTKKERDLRQFYYHGHSLVRELVMFSELGLGMRTRAVRAILEWLMTLYDREKGCFTYAGKPISKYTRKGDGIDARVAKYRFFHTIEDDWLTYHVTRIATNMMTKSWKGRKTR